MFQTNITDQKWPRRMRDDAVLRRVLPLGRGLGRQLLFNNSVYQQHYNRYSQTNTTGTAFSVVQKKENPKTTRLHAECNNVISTVDDNTDRLHAYNNINT